MKNIENISKYEKAISFDRLNNQLIEIEQGVESFLKEDMSSFDLLDKFQNYNCIKKDIKISFPELEEKYNKLFSSVDLGEAYFFD
jgi:hypothetical protein